MRSPVCVVKSIYVGFVDVAQKLLGYCMSAFKWFLIVVFAVGIVLFLYGANYYDSVVGWVGAAVGAAGLVGFLLLYIYDELSKRVQPQKS